jgi:hypothetical protein
MDETPPLHEDTHVVIASPNFEEHQIPRTRPFSSDRLCRFELGGRNARDTNTGGPMRVLHQPAAIETLGRGSTAPAVGSADLPHRRAYHLAASPGVVRAHTGSTTTVKQKAGDRERRN